MTTLELYAHLIARGYSLRRGSGAQLGVTPPGDQQMPDALASQIRKHKSKLLELVGRSNLQQGALPQAAEALYIELLAQGFVMMGTGNPDRVHVLHPDGLEMPPELAEKVETHETELAQELRSRQWRTSVELAHEAIDLGVPYHGPEGSWESWLLGVAREFGSVLEISVDDSLYRIPLAAMGQIGDWQQARDKFKVLTPVDHPTPREA